MNLIIDIGNTRTKLSVYNNGQLLFQESFINIDSDTIKNICSDKIITHAIIAATGNLPDFIIPDLEEVKVSTITLNHRTSLPIKINYHTPESLGMDRLAGVTGATILFKNQNCLVIDAGTAITYDFISAEKTFEGGSISPGMQMRYKGLHDYTDKLPLLSPEDENIQIGKNTKEAIISGIQHGITYEMNGQITHFKKIYDDLKVILTGGDALFFEKYLKKPIFVEPNLIGIGLNNILEHNVAQI